MVCFGVIFWSVYAVSLLNGSQESSIYAAASALGTISRFGPISIPKGKLSKQNETGGTDGQEGKGKKDGKITKAGLIEKLITLSVSSKMSNKVSNSEGKIKGTAQLILCGVQRAN